MGHFYWMVLILSYILGRKSYFFIYIFHKSRRRIGKYQEEGGEEKPPSCFVLGIKPYFSLNQGTDIES